MKVVPNRLHAPPRSTQSDSSHHIQPHSIIVKYMNYLWLNEVLNRRGKLWTCFRHVKAGSRKIIDIDHVERTITLFTIYALLLSIRRIDFSNFADELRMRSTLTVETQLLSNEKSRNRSSENVPLNLNLLASIFFFQYLVFGSILFFIHSR